MICGIIKVEVSVISRDEGACDNTITETLIIPHITKTEFNNCFIIHFKEKINEANMQSLYVWSLLELCLVFLVTANKHAVRAILHKNRATRCTTEWPFCYSPYSVTIGSACVQISNGMTFHCIFFFKNLAYL